MDILASALNFFLGKGFNACFSEFGDGIKQKQLRMEIQQYMDNYYNQIFYQIPIEQEFDFGGLNAFLLDNLSDKVAICFNAPRSEQRIYYKDQLLRLAYEYANAKSNKQKNSVFVYIQTILNIIENFMLTSVNGSDLFLANQTVDDITQSVKSMLEKSKSELERFIDYHNSFAEYIDSIKIAASRESNYHYLSKSIRFQGRENEFKYLDSFLSTVDPLLFAVIIGQGGAGKSKLMYNYMLQRLADPDWKIVFPKRNQFKKMKEFDKWSYPKNLLIIIDYAGEMSEDIGQCLCSLMGTNLEPRKIRIILLERQGAIKDSSGDLLDPLWYQQLIEAGGRETKEHLYKNLFFILPAMGKKELLSIIENFAENEKRVISNIDKERIYNKSKEFGSTTDPLHFNTPLYIILITDALIKGENINKLRSDTIMEYIINKYNRYIKETVCNGDGNVFLVLEKLLVYATATGGWDLTQLPPPLDTVSSIFLDQYKVTEQNLIISSVIDAACEIEILPPIEPDLIGEFYVLKFLYENRRSTYYLQLVNLFWQKPVEFANFLNRCINSYISDREELIYGRYSLFNSSPYPLVSASLLANLSAKQPQPKAFKTVEMLSEYAYVRYAGDQRIAIEYAKGLFYLSNKQETSEAVKTIGKIENLIKDYGYAKNHEMVFTYAKGLVNLSGMREVDEAAQSVDKLEKLLKNDWPDDNDITFTYSQGLFNLSTKQAIDEAEKTVIKLKELAKDKRFSDNHDIVLRYCSGLVNLAARQNIDKAVKAIDEMRELAEQYDNNHRIILLYANGLHNLSNRQIVGEPVDAIDTLKKLAYDSRYAENQEIALRYAWVLVNLCNKQETDKAEETIAELSQLAKYMGYAKNQKIVVEYAKGLFNLALKQSAGKAAETIDNLRKLAQDANYVENHEIQCAYARGLDYLSTKQD